MSQAWNFEPRASINPAAQERIGRRLRALYRSVTKEPLPMEQVELLLAFRRVERERRQAQN